MISNHGRWCCCKWCTMLYCPTLDISGSSPRSSYRVFWQKGSCTLQIVVVVWCVVPRVADVVSCRARALPSPAWYPRHLLSRGGGIEVLIPHGVILHGHMVCRPNSGCWAIGKKVRPEKTDLDRVFIFGSRVQGCT